MTKLLFLLAPLLFACRPNSKTHEAIQEIKASMKAQEKAWNSGDLTGFMRPYWNHDSLVFIGKSGLTYGWKQTLKNYQKGYPNRDAMGKLEFQNIQIKPLSEEVIWVAGQWHLFRKSDTLKGHYTLVWKRIDGQWRIVSDHSS